MQVLNNLVANSIHYTPAGGEVIVSVSQEGEDGRAWAIVKVADSGIGIPQEEMPHIFERFFRGERARLLDVPGTGLGLAISKEIVERHGGRMTVESQADMGATFAVWLPVM
jgi:signal transduction histidine kinase